jgi:hypothetical protein
MMPLVFDAMGGTHVRNRVEAFVHRVRRNREERPAGTRAAADARPAQGFAAGSAVRLKELFDQKLFDIRIPNVRLSEMKVPHLKVPDVKLPEVLLGWKKKGDPKGNGSDV